MDRMQLLSLLPADMAIVIDNRGLGILGSALRCSRLDALAMLRELARDRLVDLFPTGALPVAILTPRGLRSTKPVELEVVR
jgi:hypothetical protein